MEINAPLAELRLGASLRRYERVKLAFLVVILLVVVASGAYLIGLSHSNHQALVILKCAVDHATSFDRHGHLRTQDAARRVFDACVAKG